MLCTPGRRVLLLLALFVAGVSAAGCGSSSNGSGSGNSVQAQFVRALRGDEKAAQGGVLSYSRLGTMKTGESEDLKVSVTDVGRYQKPFTAAFERAALRGEVIDPAHVPTGGEVQVRIAECVSLTCDPILGGKQVVVDVDQPVTWEWNITAKGPGRGHITLTEVLYNANTSVVLKAARPVRIGVKIVATPKFRHSQAVTKQDQAEQRHHSRLVNDGNTAVMVTSILGSLAGVGAMVAAFLGLRSRKKKTQKRNKRNKPAGAKT